METNSAAENLQAIRSLMERSAIYRRALGPLMTFAGLTGIAAAVAGYLLRIVSVPGFICFWAGIAIIGIVGSLLLVRRQAIRSAEAFWSPPARRVAQAMTLPLTAGFLAGLVILLGWVQPPPADVDATMGFMSDAGNIIWLPAVWALFYGCALHAAGAFTPRGLRLFGWLFVSAGTAVLVWFVRRQEYPAVSWQTSHWLMGGLFGLLHLAYGIYLHLTGEDQK